MTTPEERSTIPRDLIAMLDLLAETIVETLGFGVAVVNLSRPDGSLEVVSVAGDEDARSLLLGATDTVERWQHLLSASEDWGRLRFQDHNHALADRELLTWIPVMDVADTVDAWHPEDALFAPLIAEDGALLGVLSVDLPRGGRKPDLVTRHALEAFVVSAALAIEHATMRQRAERSEQAVTRQATHDSLTGIANRALLESRLESALARDDPGTTALVFVDIDRFKQINDLHSHATGDEVLRAVAGRIVSAIRAHDTAARWGGDEFLVLLERLPDQAAAVEVVQRITESLAHPVSVKGRQLSVTASMGLSLRVPGDSLDAAELIRRADAAMYQVKRSGRDGCATFHPTRRTVSREAHLLDLLSRAVAEQRIVVHYQPLVRVADQSIVGAEALLRLRDDDGSLVPPLDFLDLARDSGHLIPIEHEVVRQACHQAASWGEHGLDLRVSVNVGAEQLRHVENFEDAVGAALTDSNLSARRLVCEITEHTLVDLTEATVAGIHRLVQRGVRLCIDDFGTGFGSFTYVQALPVHELKIDRSFVAGPDATSGAIIRAVAGLAADLGMSCVAEGVETAAQHALVLASGVPLAQGFLYARPVAAEALHQMLLSGRQAPSTGRD